MKRWRCSRRKGRRVVEGSGPEPERVLFVIDEHVGVLSEVEHEVLAMAGVIWKAIEQVFVFDTY
jgi:hypothetical protein